MGLTLPDYSPSKFYFDLKVHGYIGTQWVSFSQTILLSNFILTFEGTQIHRYTMGLTLPDYSTFKFYFDF